MEFNRTLVTGAMALALLTGIPAGHATAEPGKEPGKPKDGPVETAGNPDCTGQWVFRNLATKTNMIGQVGAAQSNYYASGGTMTLTTGYTGTVTASVSATVAVEAKAAMLASVKASINGTVANSQSVSMTNSASFSVPAGRWGNARYGRYRVVATGDSYQLQNSTCTKLNFKRVTYFVSGTNMGQGWCTWISTASLSSPPTQCRGDSPYLA